MYAIRQIQAIENGKVVVQLPDDFPADQVEVIILPAQTVNGAAYPKQNQANQALQRFLALDITHFTSDQQTAYQHACAILRKGRQQDEPRIFGLFAGLVTSSADFDTPLPDEIIALFHGSETDEYGVTLL
jgi:hypothetical protein